MSAQIDQSYKIDARPIRFEPPASAIAECVQRPAYLITPDAVTAAYMRDWRRARLASARPALQGEDNG